MANFKILKLLRTSGCPAKLPVEKDLVRLARKLFFIQRNVMVPRRAENKILESGLKTS